MSREITVLLLLILMGLLKPFEYAFWSFAALRFRLQTRLDNLRASNDSH